MNSPTATLLLVDDTPENLALLHDALDGAGYDLRIADSAEGALELLQRLTPDLILLDVLMPGMNGLELCQRLKAEPRWAGIPVIFLTVLGDPTEKIRAFEVGAIDYITKPLHAAEVVAHVRTHLAVRALQRALETEIALRLEAEAQLSRSLDCAVLVHDAGGRILFATRLAEHLLHRADPAWQPPTLPAALADGSSTLQVRRFVEPGRNELTLLFLEEAEPGPGVLRALGLSAREAEVLYWMAAGKANADIASILGTAPRTVEKHVEHIFGKLGVETRVAAARVALETMRRPG
ncbi:MAG: response regulator transcription factor [Verrucomicrobia bacterium]|nr:response regulator transcription factor [Verrucomicrobiota bacterium]